MPTIAIIGAGCAGIGAAAALMKQNDVDVHVTMIDASPIIGGRARTSTDPQGLPVDLGPQFIQDPNDNPWTGIAQSLGYTAQQLPQPVMGSLYRLYDGQAWSNSYGTDGIDAMNTRLDELYQAAEGFRNAPIMSLDAAAVCGGQQDMKLSLGSNGYGAIAESAEPWQYVVSDQARQAEVVNGGLNIYVQGGLGTLVRTYGELLVSDFALRLSFAGNKVVQEIDSSGAQVAIAMTDGESSDFDFCILTIPCSEVEKIKFTPLLPGPMARADGFIRLGSYKKVAFRPTAFPPVIAQAQPITVNGIAQNCEYYIYDREMDGVWQYFRLPTDPTILICVAAGDFARRLDGMPNNDVATAVINLLTSSYPNGDFTPANNQKVVTNWTQAPYVHGAYSYTHYDDRLPPDDPFPLEARELIREAHGRIHFAGEATWVQQYGTIHGAYNSGVRAAGEILDIIKAG